MDDELATALSAGCESKTAEGQRSLDTRIPSHQFGATLRQTHGFVGLDAEPHILLPILLPSLVILKLVIRLRF